jgi:hypothetical protein
MKNKIIIALFCLEITGCANLKYPGWQTVKIIDSAYQQPCRKVGIDICGAEECENNSDWFKKRATKYDGNHAVLNYDNDTGLLKSASYFYCASGIPVYEAEMPPLYMISNKFNPSATQLDYEKSNSECKYEAHRSTIDTAAPGPTRAYIYGTGLANSLSQLSAQTEDYKNKIHHDLVMTIEKGNLYNECMEAKGFVFRRTTDKNDIIEADKYCPDKTGATRSCFVPLSKIMTRKSDGNKSITALDTDECLIRKRFNDTLDCSGK